MVKAKWPPNDITREVRELRRQLTAIATAAKGSEWYDYTPVWSAVTTAPVLNDGILQGRYMRVGSTVFVRTFLKIGASTTMGSGAWSITLPFSIVPFTSQFDAGVMSVVAQDASAFLRYAGVAHITYDKHIWRIVFGAGTDASPTVPFTWASSDLLIVSGFYETDQ